MRFYASGPDPRGPGTSRTVRHGSSWDLLALNLLPKLLWQLSAPCKRRPTVGRKNHCFRKRASPARRRSRLNVFGSLGLKGHGLQPCRPSTKNLSFRPEQDHSLSANDPAEWRNLLFVFTSDRGCPERGRRDVRFASCWSVVPTPFGFAQGRLFENREGWGTLFCGNSA